MRARAEDDGDVYLPNPQPAGPADYVFVCMEPSLGRWAETAEDAREKVGAGFRNFLYSYEDFLLHFAARRYLCGPGERYHITDLSKGAMLVKKAAAERRARYDRWHALLKEEIALVGLPEASVIAVGKQVTRHLKRRGFPHPVTTVLHYSGQAARARREAVRGHEDEFRAFANSVSSAEVLATAEVVLEESGLADPFRSNTCERLERGELSESRKMLLFSYRMAFDHIQPNGV